MKKIIIAAVAANGVIGKDGKLPWKIPEEMKFFRETTIGNVVVMGRKTFSSTGLNPLEHRCNIVLSRVPCEPSWKREFLKYAGEYYHTSEFQSALRLANCLHDGAEKIKVRDCFIIGGASVYAQAIPICDEMLISCIRKEYEGDTLFPEFDENQFTKEIIKECEEFYVQRYTRI